MDVWSFVSLVHLLPNVPVDNLVKPQKRVGAGVVSATVGTFQRLRQGSRAPLDVHSLEFVSAIIADKGFCSSNHNVSVLWFTSAKISNRCVK